MKPNQSHVAGLELALNALQDAHLWVGSAEVRKLIGQAQSAPAEAYAERPISIPTALILWAGVDDESQPTQWHQGYEAARGYVKMQIDSAIPTAKQSLVVAEVERGEATVKECLTVELVENSTYGGLHIKEWRNHGLSAGRHTLYTAPPGIDPALTNSQCECGDEYPENSYGAGFMAANNGVCENCDTDTDPPSPDAELLELLREAVRVLDGWKNTDELDELQESIDAKLAEFQSCEP